MIDAHSGTEPPGAGAMSARSGKRALMGYNALLLRVAGGLEEMLRLHMDPGVAFIRTGEVMFLA
ncbi:hypothetical protein CYR23_18630 [Chimaeribacter arupi]|nr:hypothetical protein CYR23_18630 [Chimaeribacter arupi]